LGVVRQPELGLSLAMVVPVSFRLGMLCALLAWFWWSCSPPRKAAARPHPSADATEARLRDDIVRYALRLRGTGYRYAGKEPATGFDCSGFTSHVLSQFNIRVSPASALQAREGVSVPLESVQPGDLIIFGKNPRNIQHVAMVVENRREGIIIVHSTTTRGVVSENLNQSAYWKALVLEARDVIRRR